MKFVHLSFIALALGLVSASAFSQLFSGHRPEDRIKADRDAVRADEKRLAKDRERLKIAMSKHDSRATKSASDAIAKDEKDLDRDRARLKADERNLKKDSRPHHPTGDLVKDQRAVKDAQERVNRAKDKLAKDQRDLDSARHKRSETRSLNDAVNRDKAELRNAERDLDKAKEDYKRHRG